MGSGKVPDGWHLHDSVDTQTGPFTWDEVLKLTRAGKVTSEFKIFHPEQTKGGWVSVEKSPPLRKIFAETKLLQKTIEQKEKSIVIESDAPPVRLLPAAKTGNDQLINTSRTNWRLISLLSLVWTAWFFFVGYVAFSTFYRYEMYDRLGGQGYRYFCDNYVYSQKQWIAGVLDRTFFWIFLSIAAPSLLSFVAWAFLKAPKTNQNPSRSPSGT